MCAWMSKHMQLDTSDSESGTIDFSVPLVPAETPRSATVLEAVTHEAEPGGLASRLSKLRDKLFIKVTAYESGSSSERWDGLDTVEDGQRGQTLELGNGRFQGDLSLGIGAQAGVLSLSDLARGTLDLYAVNPVRDVSAQFDFLVRLGDLNLQNRRGFDAFIIRARAAYLGAFSGANSESTAETEYTLSAGLSW